MLRPRPASPVELATGSCCASPWSSSPLPSAGLAPAPRLAPRRWIGRRRPQRSMPAAGADPRPRPGCPCSATQRRARP